MQEEVENKSVALSIKATKLTASVLKAALRKALAEMEKAKKNPKVYKGKQSVKKLGLQGFLIMICVGIYAVLVNALSLGGDLHAAVWSCAAYTVLLCFSLFKTGSVAKSILNAH